LATLRKSTKLETASSEKGQEIVARLTREGILIGLVFLTFYFFIALCSYDASDPSWSSTGSGDDIHNITGRSGAWVADRLFSWFGYPAFLMPLILLYFAIHAFQDRNKPWKLDWIVTGLRSIGLLLVLASSCGLAGLQFYRADSALPVNSGGMLGELIAVSANSAFNPVGATVLMIATFLFGMTIFTDLSWIKVLDQVGLHTLQLYERIGTWWRKWQHERAEKQRATEAQTQRHAVVEEIVQKQRRRLPPRITPPAKTEKAQPSERVQREKQSVLFDAPVSGELPKISLLDEASKTHKGFSQESLEAMSRLLEIKLQDFGISAEVVSVLPGPVVTRFEIQPAAGIKASRISNLARDLARSLAVVSVRVVEVIPGKTVVGIEIPNEDREMVRLSQVLSSAVFDESKSPLTLALGHDIEGEPVVADLAKMPHLLVAGTTGSGKSVGVNVMLLSLLFKSSPKEVRLILVDPKMLELSVYEGIPHLLTPVVTDMNDAANALRWAVGEMERRYKLMSALGVRNLAGFNKKVDDARASGAPIKDPLWRPDEMVEGEQEASDLDTLPSIVIVIDEFADMIMIVGKKVEQLIARIAQKARAAGIHLILATQRPSVDVITGLIKANIPTRMAFQVSTKIDSRTILDQGGAEQLLGHGDMLYLPPGTGVPIRVHGAFVDDHEVHKVVADWKKRGGPAYIDGIMNDHSDIPVPGFPKEDGEGDNDDPESDNLYDEAVAFVTESGRPSISSVQRKFRIGYNRAARLIEAMEAAGVVSSMNSNGSREVLAPSANRN
jgi:S-DNA-T family DNA segregation ATPase FtsK/SpoIIIE